MFAGKTPCTQFQAFRWTHPHRMMKSPPASVGVVAGKSSDKAQLLDYKEDQAAETEVEIQKQAIED